MKKQRYHFMVVFYIMRKTKVGIVYFGLLSLSLPASLLNFAAVVCKLNAFSRTHPVRN